ncbi:TonB-dependent receptor [Pleionea sediminis]|uniref:TonB-dependent receptor n=1 Tax=Pleionea sediminis TaxID=2569479 RepID=UPI0011846C0D|nr:TonB-dependent receptor [Pleionea sediminis]
MKSTPKFICFLLLHTSLSIFGSNNNDDETSNKIVITSKRISSIDSETTSAISLIDSLEVSLLKPKHFNTLSSNVPGFWLSKGNGQEHLTAIRSPVLTGPGSCAEFIMMENSIPLRGKGFCNVNQLFDSYFEQASQIEVIRGTHSAYYGSGAIHGVINVSTSELINNRTSDTSLEATFGDFGYHDLSVNHSADNYAIKLSSMYDSGVKESSGYKQQKAQAELKHSSNTLDIHTILTSSVLDQDTAGYLQLGENAYRADSARYINQFPDAFRKANSYRIQSKITSKNNNNWIFTPYVRHNTMSFLMHFLPGQPVEKNGHDSIGFTSDFYNQLTERTSLQFGIDSEITSAYLKQIQESETDSGSDFLDAVLPQGKHYDYQINTHFFGVFSGLNFEVNEEQTLKTNLRLDYIKFDYDNRMLTGRTRDDGTECDFGGCRYTRPADRHDSFLDPSYSISYRWEHSSDLTQYLKYDFGFRLPQATELYRLQNGQTTAELESENVRSFEWGIRQSWENASLKVATYHMQKSNVIYQNTEREWVYDAKTKHYGIEWALRINFNSNWIFQSAGTSAHHKYSNSNQLTSSEISGNDIDTAPEYLNSVTLLWLPTHNLTFQGQLQHISDYYLNPENTHSYPGHTLLTFNAQWRINDKLELTLNILNATDVNYADRADYAFGQYRYFVGEPRRAFINFRWLMN